MDRRDQIAASILQGIFAGRFYVHGWNWEAIKEYIPQWVEVAYKTADAAIAESERKP